MRDFLPLLMALAAAAYVYAMRERLRRRTRVDPPSPEIGMEEAWRAWPASRTAPAELREQTLAELLDAERYCLESAHPRLALRRVILDAAVTALHLERILALDEAERKALVRGYEDGMGEMLRRTHELCRLKTAALRHYAALKHDDAVPDDWFDQFQRVARPYILEKTRLARASLLEPGEEVARLAQLYDDLLRDLHDDLLKAPPKRRFVPPDLPAS